LNPPPGGSLGQRDRKTSKLGGNAQLQRPRHQLETRWRSVSDATEAVLLPAAMNGDSFGALCERAAEQVGEANAAAAAVGVLQQWIAEGLLAEDALPA
jgi:hypothetical protein